MRIAMISTPFLAVPPADYGGTERVVHELVEGLVACGHDVTLFATGDSSVSAELRALYPQAQWPPEMPTDLNHVSWSMQQVSRGDYDVVHAHSAVALGLSRLVPDVPLVYTIHHERDEQLSGFYRYCRHAHFVAISRAQAEREVRLRVDIALALGDNNYGYPVFDPHLERRVELVPFGSSAAETQAKWLLANSERAGEIDRTCWHAVFRSQAGTVFKRAARCRVRA